MGSQQSQESPPLNTLNWAGQVFGQAPLHHLGYFLDRYDLAALETMSRVMQENARRIIRARNERLPAGKRMSNLERPFRVSVVLKELLRREGRQQQPPDAIATGGCSRQNCQESVKTVMSLDLVTKRCTTLAPMIEARQWHATAVMGHKLFVMGGVNRGITLSSVECLDLEPVHLGQEPVQWKALAPMSLNRHLFAAAALGGKVMLSSRCCHSAILAPRPAIFSSVFFSS